MKPFLIILLLALCMACQSSSVDMRGFEEANRQADKIWESYFTKCRDSVVGQRDNKIYEFKEANNLALPQQLTEADKLNGIEWKGEILGIFHGPYRIKEGGVWGPWKDDTPELTRKFRDETTQGLQKVRGEWKVDSHLGFSAVPCPE